MNRKEVKKIFARFNANANRLLQSNIDDYIDVLKKFLSYVDSTELIKNYIDSCGEHNKNMQGTFKEVMNLNSEYVFGLGDTVEEEVVGIYDILKYMSETYTSIPRNILFVYSRADSIQGRLKDFNNRIVMVLIRHIESFLTEVGIDMGLDDNIVYNISTDSGQINISNDNSTLNAVQNNGIDVNELNKLISEMRNALDENLSDEEKEEANDSIDIIENELKSEHPDEKNVKTHFKFLKKIDSGVKFINSCLALVTFVDKVFPFLSQIPTWLGVQ